MQYELGAICCEPLGELAADHAGRADDEDSLTHFLLTNPDPTGATTEPSS